MKKFLLIDLPTFPKGTLSLSLITVAAALKNDFDLLYFDLNFSEDNRKLSELSLSAVSFAGLKVSSQNFTIAKEMSASLRKQNPDIKIIWGGELPTLLQELCSEFADCVVSGLFEVVYPAFVKDALDGVLKQRYQGKNLPDYGILSPDFSLLHKFERYNTFMGIPLETSRGCTQKCLFCMVLIMQAKNYYVKSIEQLQSEIKEYDGKFINVIDYNIGVSVPHVLNLSRVIRKSGALGWMAEMNIEMLDNDELLTALQKSRCRMIYCGIESVDEAPLESINKSQTNIVANYERIIRKVQSYGINVAAGMIIGLDGADEESYKRTLKFLTRMSLAYVKITFLVYNPGTKVKSYMGKRGTYSSEEIDRYDGNSVTYLPKDMTEERLYQVTANAIREFYSLSSIVKRALRSPKGIFQKLEFLFFNICYRGVYQQWLTNPGWDMQKLVRQPYRKSFSVRLAEFFLHYTRKVRALYG